ncbi:MAG: hypothetical protein IKW20_03930 [Bacteroidales bacterium]|nr:hypothetical protein [Bacteroidales bacterium]MBR5834195.1 hypothetical protein [Bacteroidales bacterium]
MKEYNYCCSKDGHGLAFPSFSVVFIQTFSIHGNLEFVLPVDAVLSDYKGVIKKIAEEAEETKVFKSVAEHAGKPVVYMHQNIERQIFVMDGQENSLEMKKLCGDGKIKRNRLTKRYMKPLGPNESVSESSLVWRFPKKAVYRFSLRGFDFHMPLRPTEEEDFTPIDLVGHVNVEMSLFFGNTVSMTYRFFFDGNSSKILSVPEVDGGKQENTDAMTDHIIALLSTYLGAEYWSADSEEGDSNINLESTFIANDFWIDEEGREVPESERVDLNMREGGRAFDRIALRYKKFLYNRYTAYREGLSMDDMREHEHFRVLNGVSVINDHHYAMVDIPEFLKHPVALEDGSVEDLFSKSRTPKLSEAEIINHIRDYHKPELIGLMTLYPGEWPYRDGASFEEVCGENIAIDTDDQVMVGTNLAVVIGTYGRRSDEVKQGQVSGVANDGTLVQKQGVDWAKHLEERARYHVSWPEYLMILQMVLAKKYVIGFAKDQLIDVALQARDKSAEELIGKNADLGMRLSRQIIQLDVVKYSKFASHLVMFDRTTRRLHLDDDMEKLKEVTDMVDNSLHNLSDYKAMKSDFLLNMILVIVSVASTFELLFQNSEMPFLSYFEIPSDSLSAWLVLIVATITIFAILLTLKSALKKVWNMFVKYK